MFALIDCNNFYASCERVFKPKWVGKPIVVLSNNDGCVIARSNEAKVLGIPMGAPFFQYKDLIRAHNVIVCSSNYTLYGDMSARVMRTLKEFSAKMQIYSIDEAFLLLQENDLLEYGKYIRSTVLQWTGIPVSIGIAPTKTLAKIANRHAKKNFHTGGVYVLNNQQVTDHILDNLPVTEIWGIGRNLGLRLNRKGIITAKDFRDADDTLIKKSLSVVSLRTVMELRGISCLPLEELPPSKKTVTCSRAFGKPVDNLKELHEAIAFYASRAAEKIRGQDSLATMMTVFVELHPFNKDRPGNYHVRVSLPEPTDYTPHLIHYAKTAADALFQQGNRYRKAGIILDDLVPDHCYQRDLFAPQHIDYEKQKRIMKLVDHVNEHYGHNILHSAAEGVSKSWKMRQHLRSAKFTTDWDELLKIKI
jgi:DNA polymerase V